MKFLYCAWEWFLILIGYRPLISVPQGLPPQGGSAGRPKPKPIIKPMPYMDMATLEAWSASVQSWQERVIEEKTGLDAKLKRMSEFGCSEFFQKLSEDQGLLNLQHAAMEEYSRVLGQRIERFSNSGTHIAIKVTWS